MEVYSVRIKRARKENSKKERWRVQKGKVGRMDGWMATGQEGGTERGGNREREGEREGGMKGRAHYPKNSCDHPKESVLESTGATKHDFCFHLLK